MAKVVDFLGFLAKKKEAEGLDRYYDNHEDVLDLCDEVFPEGAVIIAVDDDELQVSSTIDDSDVVCAMLFSALKSIQSKSEKEEDEEDIEMD